MSQAGSQSSLQLRRLPTQKRARETFNQILSSAAELLEETGFDDFNTNLLAKRAKVGVRAIYRYFPNKHALVVELARQMADSWRRDLGSATPFTEVEADWRKVWCNYLDTFVTSVHATPGGVAVLQAMRSHPQLRAVDDAANEGYRKDVAEALLQRCPQMSAEDARLAANVLLTTTVAIVDACLDESPAKARTLMAALKTMHVAYLEQLLSAEAQ